MFEAVNVPKQEKKMLPLKLADALEQRVKEVLSGGISETPANVDGYPDLSIFSQDDLQKSGYSIRVYGEVDHAGQRFFVGPKIEQQP